MLEGMCTILKEYYKEVHLAYPSNREDSDAYVPGSRSFFLLVRLNAVHGVSFQRYQCKARHRG